MHISTIVNYITTNQLCKGWEWTIAYPNYCCIVKPFTVIQLSYSSHTPRLLLCRIRNKKVHGQVSRCDMRPSRSSRILRDYSLSQKLSIFAGEMYSTIWLAGDYFVLSLT